MKRFILGTLFCLTLGLGWLAPSVHADSTTTSTTAEQLRLVNEDGTLYLTTDIVPSADTRTTATTQQRASRRNLAVSPIVIPEGFAQNFSDLINALLSWVMVVSALLVFVYLLWGGFDWITSGGDKGKTDKARQKIIAAVIGLIIVAASYAVVNLVVRFLGFNGLNDVLNNMRTMDGSRPARVTTTPRPTASPLISPSPSPITIKIFPEN